MIGGKHRKNWIGPVALALILLASAMEFAAAQNVDRATDKQPPALIQADQVTHDRELGVITAEGNVEFSQGDRILRADGIIYNEREDVLTASGNIALQEPTGEVIFAEFVELTGDMKDGVLEGFRVLFEDDSRLAAATGQRVGGVRNELNRAVYSPCKLCEDDPTKPPLWQVKAIKVVHDAESKDLIYYDAWLEIFGVPIAYTPYLTHPDPSVERRSGFLAPIIGSSSDLGTMLQIPYYWEIAPDKDLTFDPILTASEGLVMSGEYRQRFSDGMLETRATGTNGERNDANRDKRFRGHIDTSTRFSVNDVWRWGADLKAATDDTYLKRYGISPDSTLTSHVFAEGFSGRDYSLVEGYHFQSLRSTDDQQEIPIVAPKLDYNFVGDTNHDGGRATLDLNLQALTRDIGADSRRLSVTSGWQQPYFGRLGDIWTLLGTVQSDLYHVNEVSVPNRSGDASGFTGRIFPQASLEWRHPLVRSVGGTHQFVEPISSIVVAPYGGNPNDVPNEDSRVFEFDDTNLFKPSRFAGKDRVEGGQRLNYGVKLGAFGQGGSSSTAFIGQSYRFRRDALFDPESGLEKNLSDIVGRVDLSPGGYLDLIYRFRTEPRALRPRRNEFQLGAGPDVFRLDLDYIFFDPVGEATTEFLGREEIFARLSSQFSEKWSASFDTRRDLAGGGGVRSYGAGVGYADECTIARMEFDRTFTQDRDIPPTDAVVLRVTLKNLGQIQQQVF